MFDEQDYQARDDLRTLHEAHKIKKDKKRHKAARDMAADQQAAVGNPMAGVAQSKMETTMHEFKHGKLHSGSKKGPKVKSRKQAIAIGLAQAGRAGR